MRERGPGWGGQAQTELDEGPAHTGAEFAGALGLDGETVGVGLVAEVRGVMCAELGREIHPDVAFRPWWLGVTLNA